MNSANYHLICPIFLSLIIAVFSLSFLHALGQQIDWGSEGSQNGLGRRVLMSFKEKPPGSNVTFECSPSGPCVPCLYSEKGDEKYRCSETGYRIPLKCIESENSVKSSEKSDSQNARSTLEVSNGIAESHKVLNDSRELFSTSKEQRSLLDSSSTSDNRLQAYITYRSCIPATTEDKLSVLSFEGIVILLLLVSGSIIYLRKKKGVSVSGYAAVRS
ncbi:uncharacterized protein LOC129321826 [Prosopis cineraria]|uniref:uncharacterized protein LOC129321826 n=1 Tax=Prosopis cineraria TaxID=364024 RepID=UPI00240F6AF2|nr:uncharacterized protein LOC129321826 [Prosopis cineraria]